MSTFWIARDWSVSGCQESAKIFTERPRLLGGGVWSDDGDAPHGWISPEMFASVGLPEEPKPGRCWRVDWIESYIQGERDTFPRPFARDVTTPEEEARNRIGGQA